MFQRQTGLSWLLEQLPTDIKMQIGYELVEEAKYIDQNTIIQVAKDNCEELGDDEAKEYYNDFFMTRITS
jgi:hypothetical protein